MTIITQPRAESQIIYRTEDARELTPEEKLSPIDLEIYDISGRLVKSFCHTPGALRSTQITWDGRDDRNKKLPARDG